jgi:hypothetical protein
MSEIENQQQDAREICNEIVRVLIGLGIDWEDDTGMRELAREALAFDPAHAAHLNPEDVEKRTKRKLFGLIALMFRTMQEGAETNEMIHGNAAWKALAKALWAEKNIAR